MPTYCSLIYRSREIAKLTCVSFTASPFLMKYPIIQLFRLNPLMENSCLLNISHLPPESAP